MVHIKVKMSQLQVPKLTKSNYENWSIQMKVLLTTIGCWDMIKTGYDIPADAAAKAAISNEGKEVLRKNRVRDCMALNAIHQSVDELTFEDIAEATTSRDAWKILEKIFSEKKKENHISSCETVASSEKEVIEEIIEDWDPERFFDQVKSGCEPENDQRKTSEDVEAKEQKLKNENVPMDVVQGGEDIYNEENKHVRNPKGDDNVNRGDGQSPTRNHFEKRPTTLSNSERSYSNEAHTSIVELVSVMERSSEILEKISCEKFGVGIELLRCGENKNKKKSREKIFGEALQASDKGKYRRQAGMKKKNKDKLDYIYKWRKEIYSQKQSSRKAWHDKFLRKSLE